MKAAWVESPSSTDSKNKRTSERIHVMLPARLTWKDARGSTRWASVVTRNISERGVFVELQTPITINVFRLTHFQLERDVRELEGLPLSLRRGRVLSAVYRVHPPTRAGGRQGIALRLMIDPRRRAQAEAQDRSTGDGPPSAASQDNSFVSA